MAAPGTATRPPVSRRSTVRRAALVRLDRRRPRRRGRRGLLFATSAQTAQGTDLRASGRTDLVDVIRNQTFAVKQPGRVGPALQAEVDQLTARSSPGNAAVQQGAAARPTALAPAGRHPGGHAAPASRSPSTTPTAPPPACPTASPPTTSSCTSRTSRAWSTRCGPAAPRR